MAEEEVGSILTVDHFRPRARGGTGDEDNLVYCCHASNEFKGEYWNEELSLLHPRLDNPIEHVELGDDFLLTGRTRRGAHHIVRLHLNRAALVLCRRRRADEDAVSLRIQRADLDHEALLAELNAIRSDLEAAHQRINRIDREISRARYNREEDEA